jgi:hypothetical protein
VWPHLKRRSLGSAVLQKPVSRPGSKASWTAEESSLRHPSYQRIDPTYVLYPWFGAFIRKTGDSRFKTTGGLIATLSDSHLSEVFFH